MNRNLKAAVLSLVTLFACIFLAGNTAFAAKPMLTYSDFPVNAFGNNGAFVANANLREGQSFDLQGWVAVDNLYVQEFEWKYTYNGKNYTGGFLCGGRPDVASVYPNYKTYAGYYLNKDNPKSIPQIDKLPAGASVSLKIYASIGKKETLIGTYNIKITKKVEYKDLLSVAKREYDAWQNMNSTQRNEAIKKYLKCTGKTSGSWCAAFVSYCAQESGYTQIRSSSCKALRNYFIGKGKYISNYNQNAQVYNTVKPGDVVFFIGGQKEAKKKDDGTGEKYETHHVGIVNSIRKEADGRIIVNLYDGNYAGNIAHRDFALDYKLENTVAIGHKAILGFGLMH